MKKINIIACAITMLIGMSFLSCNKGEDYSKFTKEELAGKWIYPQYEYVWGYLEIKSSTAQLFMNKTQTSQNGDVYLATYKNGIYAEGDSVQWRSWGEYAYTFDEKEQILYVEDEKIIKLIGTNKLLVLQRTGKDEAIVESELLNKFLPDKTQENLDLKREKKVYRIH